jgi:plastocyanin
MRLATIAAAFAALTFLTAACASADEAGWTYAPPPTEVAASGAPSGEPGSPAPSAEPSAAPSASASAAPSGLASPAASPATGGETVTVTAANIAFDPTELQVPADTAFTLELVNNDAQVPHDIAIRDQGGTEMFKTDTFAGVETRSFDAPALPAGSYQFVCTVHPNMVISVTSQ